MLAGQTVIHTLTGDQFVADLVDQTVYVFTWDGLRVTVGRVMVTKGKIAVPTRLEFEEGGEVSADADTRVFLRDDYEYPVPIREICVGTSLLPLYLKTDKAGFPLYREPGDWPRNAATPRDKIPWRRVDRMVAESNLRRRLLPNDVVKLKDGVKRNCLPDNVFVEQVEPRPRRVTPKFMKAILDAQKVIDDLNHKVADIHLGISDNLYSIRGIDSDNLAAGGVFVCVDEG